METNTSLTDNQTKSNQTNITDTSLTDKQTKPNQINTIDTPADSQTKQNQTNSKNASATDSQTKQSQAQTTDASLTHNQAQPNETSTTDTPVTDGQGKSNQNNTSDSSFTENQAKLDQINGMDTTFMDVDLKPEKIEDMKDEDLKFHCELSDKAMVHKIALALLEGLSTACIDMTTGSIFMSAGTVAADVRKEMLEYLTERSQSFVAETIILDGGPQEEKSDHPFDILSDFIDDFLALKRSLLSRVSGWLLSDMREDKIDDFVQEMDLNSFWLLDRRETISQTLLKNVDFKNEFHCNKKFKTEEELRQHCVQCGFRTVMCENEGCNATFSAAHMEEHDSMCPFKRLSCEQKCPEILMRREMDRHCITVCPRKLVNCPFYSIGCQATVPSCDIGEHCSNDVRSHLLHALQYHHKGASPEDLTPRLEQIEQESSGRLAGMQGVRTFTNAVKNMDSKLGPFKIEKKHVDKVDDAKTSDSSEQPADKEKEAKTSDSVDKEKDSKTDFDEHHADKEKDVKTSDSVDKDKDSKTDSDEHHAEKGKDAKTSDSGNHHADKEKDTKMSEFGERPKDKETDERALGFSENLVEDDRDAKTSDSGEHTVVNKLERKTSELSEKSIDKEKEAKKPVSNSDSDEHPLDKEKTEKNAKTDSSEHSLGKERVEETSDSCERSAQQSEN